MRIRHFGDIWGKPTALFYAQCDKCGKEMGPFKSIKEASQADNCPECKEKTAGKNFPQDKEPKTDNNGIEHAKQ